MPKNWNKTVSIQEAKAAYAVGDDLGAYCFLYEGDRVRHVRIRVSGDIVTLPPYVPPATLYTKTSRFIDSLIADIVPLQEGTGDPSPDNIRPINGWSECNITISPTLDTEDEQTYTVIFPSEAGTVYGGTLDATMGILTVNRAIVDLSTLQWNYFQPNPGFYANVLGKTNTNIQCDVICSQYTSYSINGTSATIFSLLPDKSVTGFYSPGSPNSWVYIHDSAYTDVATFKAALNGVQLVYELATPRTYQLTPTEIVLLPGENNIFADTGPIILNYVETEEV